MDTDQITNDKNPFTDLVDEFENSLKVKFFKKNFVLSIMYLQLKFYLFLIYQSFVSLYNIEVPETRTNNEFGKKAAQSQIELNKKSNRFRDTFFTQEYFNSKFKYIFFISDRTKNSGRV